MKEFQMMTTIGLDYCFLQVLQTKSLATSGCVSISFIIVSTNMGPLLFTLKIKYI